MSIKSEAKIVDMHISVVPLKSAAQYRVTNFSHTFLMPAKQGMTPREFVKIAKKTFAKLNPPMFGKRGIEVFNMVVEETFLICEQSKLDKPCPLFDVPMTHVDVRIEPKWSDA